MLRNSWYVRFDHYVDGAMGIHPRFEGWRSLT